MKLDISGAELFLAYMQGRADAEELLRHPAYRVVCAHAAYNSAPVGESDVDAALKGEPSPFYGLGGVLGNVPAITALLDTIKAREQIWLATAESTLGRLLPREDLSNITVYPIVGYDAGIGFGNAVCTNLNWQPYLSRSEEFLYFLIHEVFHVVYERHHLIPRLDDVRTPEEWLSYFYMWLQNEGYATYAPLALREERGHLDDGFGDYRVLSNPARIKEHITAFSETVALLRERRDLTAAEYAEHLFSPWRLTYRVGCELIRRIAYAYGLSEVRCGVYLSGKEFMDRYGHLLTEKHAVSPELITASQRFSRG